MNELRMYVEHLFEGKVLTSENIELKEEIYGNLVARYQDYVASGMSEAEALEKTKASVPSVDDVLRGEDASGDASAEDAATVVAALTPQTEAAGQPTSSAASAQDAPAASASSAVAGAPTRPSDYGAETATPTKKKWPLVVGIVAAVLVVLTVVVVAFNVVVEPALDYAEDSVEDVLENNSNKGGTSNTNGGTTGGNASAGQQQTPTFTDPEEQREYEATMALLQEIDSSDAGLLQVYAGRGTSSEVSELASELPLGANRREAGLDNTVAATAYIDYTNVSEDIDGDAIDRALTYNALAVFSVYPDISTLRVTLQEVNDSQWDADTYSFDRTRVEQSLAAASNNAITQLNSSLFESTDAWSQVKSYLDYPDFADHVVEWAETN